MRALRRFLAKMQTNVYGKLGESFLQTVGSQKNTLVERDSSISVESAGSQKIP